MITSKAERDLHQIGRNPVRALGIWEVHEMVLQMGFYTLSFSKKLGDYDPKGTGGRGG